MKISDDGARIVFKSHDPFFRKEKLGYKPNTARRIANQADKENLFSSLFGLIEIEIENVDNPEDRFVRLLSDITYFEDYFIFSWIHSEA